MLEVYLRRANKVSVDFSGQKYDYLNLVISIQQDIEQFGYLLHDNVIKSLLYTDIEYLTEFHYNLVNILKKLTGADVRYKPMYVNFPSQVMSMTEADLYYNAMLHYFGDLIGCTILPDYPVESRKKLKWKKKYKIIKLGSQKDFLNIMKNLINSKTSLSDQDKKDINFCLKKKFDILPQTYTNRENMCYVLNQHLLYNHNYDYVYHHIKTGTDVLRLATAMSDGDVSLAENTKFRNFKRKERDFLLKGINKCVNCVDDYAKYQNRFVRLGEKLHPGEQIYRCRYPKVFELFQTIRNDKFHNTYNSKLELYFKHKKFNLLLLLLVERPGIFARSLNRCLEAFNNNGDQTDICFQFMQICDKLPNVILMQVWQFFNKRDQNEPYRVFFPKGNTAKVKCIKNKQPLLNKDICKLICKTCAKQLKSNFRKLPPIKVIGLDKKLKNYLIPFSQRSASNSLRTIVRGSKIPLECQKTIRFFIWWTEDGNERIDVDLSAVAYKEGWEYDNHISYTNLKSEKGIVACHSGDLTSARKGAAEFIDIDIKSCINSGVRYIVMNVISYTRQPFNKIPRVFAGWMNRTKPKSGEIFEPKTVENRFDLCNSGTNCIPLIIDLKENKVIWCDLAYKSNMHFNNVELNYNSIVTICRGIENINKMSLYSLFKLHQKARHSEQSDNQYNFTVDPVKTEGVKNINAFSYEEIVSNWI